MSVWQRLVWWLRKAVASGDDAARAKAVDGVETELEELEHVFGLLTLGSFVGLPSPPAHLALELMPEMERELILLLQRVDTAAAPYSHLFSTFDVD